VEAFLAVTDSKSKEGKKAMIPNGGMPCDSVGVIIGMAKVFALMWQVGGAGTKETNRVYDVLG